MAERGETSRPASALLRARLPSLEGGSERKGPMTILKNSTSKLMETTIPACIQHLTDAASRNGKKIIKNRRAN